MLETYARASMRADADEPRGGGEARCAGRWPPARAVQQPSSNRRNYIVPGLISVILMIIAALITSLTIAREWENGHDGAVALHAPASGGMVLGKARRRSSRLASWTRWSRLLVGVWFFRVPLRGSMLLLIVVELHVPVRRSVLGHPDFGSCPNPVAGLPDGPAEFVSAGVPAVGLRILHRKHAEGDSGDHATWFRRGISFPS